MEIPAPSQGKGGRVPQLFLSDPGCPLLPAPSPTQDSCPRLGSTALQEGKGSMGKREKEHSAEKENMVKRTVERRRAMRVK